MRYNFELALRGLRRFPKSSVLVVLTVALGLAACMTTLTLLHVLSADPLPGRSQDLYLAWVNTLTSKPSTSHSLNGVHPVDYRTIKLPDAEAMLGAHKAVQQTALADMTAVVSNEDGTRKQENQTLLATTSSFMPMFGVTLRHGRDWSAAEGKAREHVAVIDTHLARQLFGTTQAVGRSIRIRKTLFRVVGVSEAYSPQPHFYDLADWTFSTGPEFHESVFLPYTSALDAGLGPDYDQYCDDASHKQFMEGFEKFGERHCDWLSYWVRLDTPHQVAAFRAWLDDYAEQRQALQGIHRAVHARLFSIPQWLTVQRVVPDSVRLNAWMAASFLLLCMANVAGLLTARFLRRSGEIGIRRALGAPRRAIFVQHVAEAAAVCVLGGVLALPLTLLGLWILRLQQHGDSSLARLDPAMFGFLFALALVVGILVGLVPAWRASRVEPGLQVKSA